jgi:hypothetical protein
VTVWGGVEENHNSQAMLQQNMEEIIMRRSYLFALGFALLLAGVAAAQYPILDAIADKVVQKYQNSTCEQLWQEKGKPKPPREQEAIQMLRNEPQMRLAFINRVAAPIANKMFECGMIP